MSLVHQKNAPAPAGESVQSNLTCVLSIVLFAAGFPAAEILLQDWGVIALITARNVLAFALLIALWAYWEGSSALYRADWAGGFLIGAVGFGVGSLLLLITQYLTTPIIAALAAATMPLAAVGLEVLLDGRRITRWFAIGVSLVLVGGYIATGSGLSDGAIGWGALLGIIASTIFAWGSRETVKGLPELTSLGQAVVTTSGMVGFSGSAFIVLYVLNDPGIAIPQISMTHIGLLLIYAWCGLAISQILWIVGVSKLGIGLASFHLNAAPFYAMAILFLLGNPWDWQQTAGAAIVIFGVILSQKRTTNRQPPNQLPQSPSPEY